MKFIIIKKAISILLSLVAIIAIFYVVTIVVSRKTTDPSINISISDDYNKKLSHNGLVNMPDKENLQGYGIRIFDEEGLFLTLLDTKENGDIECYVSLANMNNYTDNSALMIFIDGLIQDFYVDNKKVDEYVYFFKMDPFSIRNIPITLSNLLLENKKNHNITFVYLNKIQESPKDEFCSSFFIAPLTLSLNINNNAKYSFEEEIDAIYSNISKKDVFLIDKEFNLSITKPHSSIDLMSQDNIELISDKYIRLRIDASDIETNLYKTYIFIDYIPVAVNEDKKYLKWISSPNEIMSTEVMINSPNSGEYCVFTISFPEHYEHKSALESRKFNLSINPHFNIESTNEFE